MKSWVKVLFTTVLFISLFSFGCGGGGGGGGDSSDIANQEQCSFAYTCSATGSEMEACCTSTQCRYLIGDKEFLCDGLNCSDAAKKAVDYCIK